MSRWLIELIAALLLGGGFYGWWVYHDHQWEDKGIKIQVAADKAGAEKQKAIDDKIIADTKVTHATEIDNLKKAYQDAVLTPGVAPKPVVCYYSSPSSVPEADVHSGTSSTSPVVQADSGLYQQRAAAFELLLKRADGLSADARQLEQETHAGH